LPLPELIARGRYDHPWLRVTGYPLTPQVAKQLDWKALPVERGVLIIREGLTLTPAGRRTRLGCGEGHNSL
jgi:S1-C subfamily serine protease